jgi:hypothetical protein
MKYSAIRPLVAFGLGHAHVLILEHTMQTNCAREVTGTDTHITPALKSRLAD